MSQKRQNKPNKKLRLKDYKISQSYKVYSDYKKDYNKLVNVLDNLVKNGDITDKKRRAILKEIKKIERTLLKVEKKTYYYGTISDLDYQKIKDIKYIEPIKIEPIGGRYRIRASRQFFKKLGKKLGSEIKLSRKRFYRDLKSGKFISLKDYERQLKKYIDNTLKERVKKSLGISDKRYNKLIKYVDKEHLLRVINNSPRRFTKYLKSRLKAMKRKVRKAKTKKGVKNVKSKKSKKNK